MDSIGLIKTKAKKLENSRNEVIQAVSQLSETSQHNVVVFIKTHDETVEVADTFKDVAQSAKRLQQIADNLQIVWIILRYKLFIFFSARNHDL